MTGTSQEVTRELVRAALGTGKTELVQMNLSVPSDFKDRVDGLAEELGWSKRQVIEIAVGMFETFVASEREP